MKLTWVVVLALAAPASIAHADEATAREAFGQGERAYNLGQFAQAAELFRKAYEEWPEPAFLFNLAQTFRQIGDCKQAAFFYKRFLALKEQDTKKPLKPELKAEVEKRIVELDECMKRDIANKPPNQLDNGGTTTTGTGTGTTTTTGTGTTGTGTGTTGGTQTATGGGGEGGGEGEGEGEGDDGSGVAPLAGDHPKMLSLRVGLGAGKLGAGDLPTKVQFAASLIAGYPLAINEKLRIDLGALFTFTPVPYETDNGMKGSGKVIGVGVNAGPSFKVAPKISLRADVGLGVQLFAGLSKPENPFLTGTATGALSSFLLRTALSADYAITPNVVLTVTPIAFSYSPAPAGFEPGISSLTTITALAGVAYQR